MKTLTTRWADQAMCENPLQEHPQPQMKRENWQNLNGMFDYAITKIQDELCEVFDGKIRVPFAIESCLSGVCKSVSENENLWYKKTFTIDENNKDKHTILHFEAVDWQCFIYINKHLVGSHIGGYCPFSFDVTEFLVDGENELIVKVFDPTDKSWQNRGKQAGKSFGFWYTSTTGIWQTVWLEFVEENHIESYKINTDIDNEQLDIQTTIIGKGKLEIKVYDGETVIVRQEITQEASVKIPNMKLWSPESPFLYNFELTLENNGEVCDKVQGYFGMRKFSIGEHDGYNRLFLNNEPYFQRGLLDQGYWSDGGMTAPTDEALIYDITTMKRLGFNMLRKHIKRECNRWYYHCDRLGMIVWQDMISGGQALDVFHAGVLSNIQSFFSPLVNLSKKDNDYNTFKRERIEARSQFEDELIQLMDSLHNHTCIGCWVPFNEGWGQFDAKRIGEMVKEKDPSRIVDHASGWYDQKGAELRSQHVYIRKVRAPKYDGRPYVLSEYGGYSQIIDGHIWNKSKSFGYQMYKSKETLTNAYQKLHEKQIIPLIKKGLSATVYTQVSDVEFEVNGILSYDREIVKIDEKTAIDINTSLKY
ncbi:MAG: glycoside hydrolase family 2 TIM barrel-domain containing protein [Clostridia bacterium]